MKLFLTACAFVFFLTSDIHSQDARAILEKSYNQCIKLKGGSFKMMISKKSFSDTVAALTQAGCSFLKVPNDSVLPWKFFVRMGNGDGSLCNGNELIQLKAKDSTGTIYSKNHSEYSTALQNEGLFLPFFQPQTIFNIERLGETNMVLRMTKDEEVMKKNCYVIHLIDVSRLTRPNSEKQEKVFFIDKQSYMPLGYSEINVAKVAKDSLVKSEEFKLKELNTSDLPHDSVFTYKSIPDWFQLKTTLGTVYHHHLKTGTAAPFFSGRTTSGDSLSLISLRGKKVLLYFFSHSSYPSLKSLTALQNFQDKNNDVAVILLSMDKGQRDISDLLKRRNITLKTIARAQPIADAYFITAAPTFVIIDGKGIIKDIETGFGERTEEKLMDKIK